MPARTKKLVESPLFVYTAAQGRPRHVGTLVFTEDRPGEFAAEFNYSETYLALPDASPLDPINLRLTRQRYNTTSRYHLLGAIFDAAPDAWGRRIIAADEGVTEVSERTVLVKGHGMGVGDLLFATDVITDMPVEPPVAAVHDIERLAVAIGKMDAGQPVSEADKQMFTGSWDLGGARPKAIVRDVDGSLWIAKFSRRNESYSRERVEWANLEMADQIKMAVPEHRLIETSTGAVLLVKRFDRDPVDPNLRRHFLSAVSLISLPENWDKREMDTPRGKSYFSYARIADVIKQVSSNPTHDLQEMFARMVFNVMVHNVDDHLKNTGFLRDLDSPIKYRLSPLYDVVTQEGSVKHMLHLGEDGRESSLENALSEPERMGLKSTAAAAIADRVAKVVADRAAYYGRAGLSAMEQNVIERQLLS